MTPKPLVLSSKSLSHAPTPTHRRQERASAGRPRAKLCRLPVQPGRQPWNRSIHNSHTHTLTHTQISFLPVKLPNYSTNSAYRTQTQRERKQTIIPIPSHHLIYRSIPWEQQAKISPSPPPFLSLPISLSFPLYGETEESYGLDWIGGGGGGGLMGKGDNIVRHAGPDSSAFVGWGIYIPHPHHTAIHPTNKPLGGAKKSLERRK
jgi:hypothetical protein